MLQFAENMIKYMYWVIADWRDAQREEAIPFPVSS